MFLNLEKRRNLLLQRWWKSLLNIKQQWSLVYWGNKCCSTSPPSPPPTQKERKKMVFSTQQKGNGIVIFVICSLFGLPGSHHILLFLYSGRKGNSPERFPLPPPVYGTASFSSKKPSRATSFQQSTSSYHDHSSSFDTAPSAPSAPTSTYDSQVYINRTIIICLRMLCHTSLVPGQL